MKWLALDIGGENIKTADGRGYAASHAFALWLHHQRLADKLRAIIAEAPPSDHLAVTMTGELADCFTTKTEGVAFILRAVERAADGRHTRVYLNNGDLVAPRIATARPLEAAASNWHALATFCGRYAKSHTGLLIDIGSTTTDIVPLRGGQPPHAGHTDLDRLLNQQLVYTGVARSPICALVQTLPYHNVRCPVAQELFATTRDVYLILEDVPESTHDLHTADRQPATIDAACRQLGRMLSADEPQYNMTDAQTWAEDVARVQLQMIIRAGLAVVAELGSAPRVIILSGQGEFLGRRVAERLAYAGTLVSLTEQLGAPLSRCAPAHALAVLARESAQPGPSKP